jgi:hypothetical protein
MKFQEGDRVTTPARSFSAGRVAERRSDGRYVVVWEADSSMGVWDEDSLVSYPYVPEAEDEWRCTGGDLEQPGYVKTYSREGDKESWTYTPEPPPKPYVEPPFRSDLETDNGDALERISRMLILTNLAHRLGIPEPCSVDMSWDSLEYIEWVLWRCDGRIPQ